MLLVVKKCVGVISDGDIRNKIVLGLDIDSPLKEAMNKNYVFVKDTDNHHAILRQFDKKITNLPVLDENGLQSIFISIQNFWDLQDLRQK